MKGRKADKILAGRPAGEMSRLLTGLLTSANVSGAGPMFRPEGATNLTAP